MNLDKLIENIVKRFKPDVLVGYGSYFYNLIDRSKTKPDFLGLYEKARLSEIQQSIAKEFSIKTKKKD